MSCDRIEGYQAGCDAYLPKPFNPDELVAIVENLLSRRVGINKISSSTINDIVCKYPPRTYANTQLPSPIKLEFTPREQSILDLVAEGLMNKEIARRLNTSVRNVEKYVSRLFNKTGTNSRTELVRYAFEHGLKKL